MFRNRLHILFSFLFFTIITFGNAQIRDTLIIKFNDSNPKMGKGKRFIYTTPVGDSLFSYYYDIKAIEKYTYINLGHHIQSPKTIEYFDSDYVNPITKIVNKDYLKGKRILDISFFKTHTFEEIRALFKGEDRPFLFLYEVGDRKNGKIVLREVRFMDYLRI